MLEFNIEYENTYDGWDVSSLSIVENAKKILQFYLECDDIKKNLCLNNYKYNKLSFDILFCDGNKTHEINREYRNKDYPADIITFAVFSDSNEDERFVLGFEINLGEVIIALDKIIEQANSKNIDKKDELYFFIAHGIMHLLGFDHRDEEEFEFVVSHQKKALESIGIIYDKI